MKTILYYSGHIIAAYEQGSIIDIYKVNGPLMQTMDLQSTLPNHQIATIDHIMIPRLDWQDREFDTIQRASKVLPRKIFFAGTYIRQARQMPIIMIHDRE